MMGNATARWRISWGLFWGSTVGEAVTMSMWLLGLISTRTMVGITLALSWAALQYEAYNALQISKDRKDQDDGE